MRSRLRLAKLHQARRRRIGDDIAFDAPKKYRLACGGAPSRQPVGLVLREPHENQKPRPASLFLNWQGRTTHRHQSVRPAGAAKAAIVGRSSGSTKAMPDG